MTSENNFWWSLFNIFIWSFANSEFRTFYLTWKLSLVYLFFLFFFLSVILAMIFLILDHQGRVVCLWNYYMLFCILIMFYMLNCYPFDKNISWKWTILWWKKQTIVILKWCKIPFSWLVKPYDSDWKTIYQSKP